MSKQHRNKSNRHPAQPEASARTQRPAGKGGRRFAAFAAGLTLGAGLLAWLMIGNGTPPAQAADEVVVYKSPTCGCCGDWVEHLRQNGFKVRVENQYDLTPIKQRYGIGPELQSCHTAQVGNYFIEGHVPAGDIQRLLAERPDIRGLAVPGMPMGSPGMEGPYSDHYEVVAVGRTGNLQTYSRH